MLTPFPLLGLLPIINKLNDLFRLSADNYLENGIALPVKREGE